MYGTGGYRVGPKQIARTFVLLLHVRLNLKMLLMLDAVWSRNPTLSCAVQIYYCIVWNGVVLALIYCPNILQWRWWLWAGLIYHCWWRIERLLCWPLTNSAYVFINFCLCIWIWRCYWCLIQPVYEFVILHAPFCHPNTLKRIWWRYVDLWLKRYRVALNAGQTERTFALVPVCLNLTVLIIVVWCSMRL